MNSRSRALITASSALLSVLLASCGSGSGSSGSSGSSGPAGSITSGGVQVDLTAARNYTRPYATPPSKFPATAPLKRLPKPGSTVAYLDVGVPVAARLWEYLQPTANILHIKLLRVRTGNDAQSITTALNSVVESHPAAVINDGLDLNLFAPQLEQMKKKGITVVPAGIIDGEKFGFPDDSIIGGRAASVEGGKVLASAVLDKTDGKAHEFVFYNVPELPFSELQQEGAKQQMAALCPACTLRTVNIPVSAIGTTASRAVITDLQAHPETQAFMGALDEIQIGLPAAQKAAGLNVPGIGEFPSPTNNEQIKSGEQLGALALDEQMFTWMLMDQAVREMAGQKVSYPSGGELGINHLIYKQNAPADSEVGYVSFPDYQARFTKLWTGR